MKKAVKITSLLLILIITGCSTDYYDGAFDNDPESGWVEFESVFTQASTGSTISIPVFQRSATNEQETVVTYTVTKSENSPADAPAEVLGTYKGKIPAGKLEGVLVMELPAGSQNYTLDITLTETSQSNLIIGLEGDPGEHPIVHTVQVCDGAISTSYSGESFYNGGSVTTFPATLTPVSEEDKTYKIDTAWGTDFVAILAGDPNLAGQYVYSGTLTINDDNSVVLVADDLASFPEGGTGTYDPCTKTFDLLLTQAVFTNNFTVDVVLTAN